MPKYTNKNGVSLPMAVWLARDQYDHDPRTNVISATSLLKSIRQIVLSSRIEPSETKVEDVSDRLASRIGTAIHDSVEHSWTENYATALSDLGYPASAIDRVTINPTEVKKGDIPVYFELRSEKQVGKWIVSGQFDIVFDGAVHDVKSTSVYTYINKTNDDKYIQQMSIYRWLNPDKITKPEGAIQFIFKDWQKHMAIGSKTYPSLPVLEYKLRLKSIPEIEMWVQNKLNQIDLNWDKPEPELPLCTPDDLWQDPPKFKYYSKPDSKRASKNFDTMHEASQYQLSKGKGIVKEVYGEPKACRYCPAAGKCSQFAGFVKSGLLKL
ncbi:PD-(D/E)XK nuclease superfamily protein [Vibrio phage vB_VhaP_PG11]|nr:PD-(D/E)XK nuclease superfamily protein [Vibrio phage vB_VhaP_PG11]